MIKILQLNDTHKGFSSNTDSIHRNFFKKIEKLDFDVLVHCGDMSSVKQKSVKASFQQLRKAAKDKPVLVVRGNHDYWQENSKSASVKRKCFYEVLEDHQSWAREFGIQLLDEGEYYETEGVFIGGFTTWYKDSPIGTTNDFRWMDRLTSKMDDVNSLLQTKEIFTLTNLVYQLEARIGKPRVVVSHMPCFGTDRDQRYTTNFSNQIALKWNCEYYLCGHSHKEYNGENMFGGGVSVYQTGSDYNKPKFKIIEVV